jgi:hypothetical protein
MVLSRIFSSEDAFRQLWPYPSAVAASSHELAQKGIAAAIRVHVSGVDEIAFLKFVRHLICSDLLW